MESLLSIFKVVWHWSGTKYATLNTGWHSTALNLNSKQQSAALNALIWSGVWEGSNSLATTKPSRGTAWSVLRENHPYVLQSFDDGDLGSGLEIRQMQSTHINCTKIIGHNLRQSIRDVHSSVLKSFSSLFPFLFSSSCRKRVVFRSLFSSGINGSSYGTALWNSV
jgi:hypothetical protein